MKVEWCKYLSLIAQHHLSNSYDGSQTGIFAALWLCINFVSFTGFLGESYLAPKGHRPDTQTSTCLLANALTGHFQRRWRDTRDCNLCSFSKHFDVSAMHRRLTKWLGSRGVQQLASATQIVLRLDAHVCHQRVLQKDSARQGSSALRMGARPSSWVLS